jgi:hypothetical protein
MPARGLEAVYLLPEGYLSPRWAGPPCGSIRWLERCIPEPPNLRVVSYCAFSSSAAWRWSTSLMARSMSARKRMMRAAAFGSWTIRCSR